MPAVVWEERGRTFTLGEGRVENTLRYIVTDSFSESETLAAISLVVPTIWNNLYFLNTEAEEESIGIWRGTANYGVPTGGSDIPSQLLGPGLNPPPPPPPAADEALGPEWSFTTSGGTQHITTSIETIQSEVGFGFGTPPDNKRVIGASKTGVEGCDVIRGKLEFTKTVKIPQISLNYLRTLVDLTACVNEDTFLGIFLQGEVLYLGADGNFRDNEGWSVVHRFSAAPNKDPVNDSSTNPLDRIAPRGHDFVWCDFEDTESNGRKIPVPSAAYVEQVYYYGDFDKLGI
jgi:hypothetical protein